MTHAEKLAHFEKQLEERGYWKANAEPPVFRLLWKLGVEVPPPYFLSFGQAWIVAGAPFGFLMGLFCVGLFSFFSDSAMALFFWPSVGASALTCGTLFGLCMAFWWGRQRDQLGLPSWQEYPGRQGETPEVGSG